MRPFALLLAALSLLAAGPVLGAGDADAGKRLATAWCTGCHVAEGKGADTAPPLSAIATKTVGDPGYLFAWLSTPHPVMPQLSLSRQEIADLIAYLQSLRN